MLTGQQLQYLATDPVYRAIWLPLERQVCHQTRTEMPLEAEKGRKQMRALRKKHSPAHTWISSRETHVRLPTCRTIKDYEIINVCSFKPLKKIAFVDNGIRKLPMLSNPHFMYFQTHLYRSKKILSLVILLRMEFKNTYHLMSIRMANTKQQQQHRK